jgi:ATP-dependent DNA ligase
LKSKAPKGEQWLHEIKFDRIQVHINSGKEENLWRDGNLRNVPQMERKQALPDLLGENDIELPILYSEHLNCQYSTLNISPATGNRCLNTPRS